MSDAFASSRRRFDGFLTLLISIPVAAFLRFFARPSTWRQALIISIFGFLIAKALLAVYFLC